MSDSKSNMYKTRSLGRVVAFQELYQDEMNPGTGERDRNEALDAYCAEAKVRLLEPERAEALAFARRLFEGVVDRRAEVDALIGNALNNRTLAQTTVVDRNILRVCAYEIRFVKTPKAVVIAEAIELGKKFGAKESRAFLNGVLDKIDN